MYISEIREMPTFSPSWWPKAICQRISTSSYANALPSSTRRWGPQRAM